MLGRAGVASLSIEARSWNDAPYVEVSYDFAFQSTSTQIASQTLPPRLGQCLRPGGLGAVLRSSLSPSEDHPLLPFLRSCSWVSCVGESLAPAHVLLSRFSISVWSVLLSSGQPSVLAVCGVQCSGTAISNYKYLYAPSRPSLSRSSSLTAKGKDLLGRLIL